MLLHITILLKCFITLGTCKWLLTSVVLSCTFKLQLWLKAFFTFGTGKWFLSCVSPFMMQRVSLAKHSVLQFKGDHHTTFYIEWFLLLSLDVSGILEHMLLWLFPCFMGLHMVFKGLYYQNCLKTGPIPDQGLCPVRVRPGPVRVRKISVRSGPVPLGLYLKAIEKCQ